MGKERRVLAAGTVFEHHRKTAGVADPGNGRRRKGGAGGFGQFRQFAVDVLVDRGDLLGGFGALAPGLEGHKKEGVVGGLHLAQETETLDRCAVFDAGRAPDDFLDFFTDGVGALK